MATREEKIEAAWAEYEKIRNPAEKEYRKICNSALAEYEKIRNPAWAEYNKIFVTAKDD